MLSPGAPAQVITTYAGVGPNNTCSGDGGPATAANIYGPWATAFDNNGNFYIADGNNNRIRRVDCVTGIITTVVGTGTAGYNGDGIMATAAELQGPQGVAFDAAGNMYIADVNNFRIRKVDGTGMISTVAGNGMIGYNGDNMPATAAEMYNVMSVVVDIAGNLYIADAGNNLVRKINTSGIINSIAGSLTQGYSGDGGPATAAELYYPEGVAIDAGGNIYIADDDNDVIRKVTPAGIITTFAGNGATGYSGDGGPATAAELAVGTAVGTDAAGNVYIADYENAVVRKVDLTGTITTFAGDGNGGFSGDGGPATAAELFYPCGVTVGPDGAVYITDGANDRIRRVGFPEAVKNVASSSPFTVYPNPSQGFFTVGLQANAQSSTISIYDLYGRVMRTKEVGAGIDKVQIDLDNVAPGNYLLKVQGNSNCDVRKIVIE